MIRYRFFVLSAAAVLAFSTAACAADYNSIRSDINEQLREVKTVSDQMKWQVEEANKRAEDLEKEVGSLRKQLAEVSRANEQKLAEMHAKIAAFDEKHLKLEAELDKKMQVILEEVTKENERILSKVEKGSKPKKEKAKKEPAKKSGDTDAAAPAPDETHEVGPGETLSKIARSYGMAVSDLMELNGITDANSVRVGQKLKVRK
ncbi:MAG TPA: LysM peptidoglycan-binding domain-containing protein [bacterium]|nr:LysM peptidoglycan-binding domain-containing protein [bacterium]